MGLHSMPPSLSQALTIRLLNSLSPGSQHKGQAAVLTCCPGESQGTHWAQAQGKQLGRARAGAGTSGTSVGSVLTGHTAQDKQEHRFGAARARKEPPN